MIYFLNNNFIDILKQFFQPDIQKNIKDRLGSIRDKKESSAKKLLETEKNKLKNIIKQSSSKMRSTVSHESDEYESDGRYTPEPLKVER